MKAIPFFSDDVTVIPHSASSELADTLESPITIAEFTRRTGNHPVSLFETESGELYVASRPRESRDGRIPFIEGRAA
jgi:hypothetical protein